MPGNLAPMEFPVARLAEPAVREFEPPLFGAYWKLGLFGDFHGVETVSLICGKSRVVSCLIPTGPLKDLIRGTTCVSAAKLAPARTKAAVAAASPRIAHDVAIIAVFTCPDGRPHRRARKA